MGLIYDEYLNDPLKATECYQKYLEYAPLDAPHRDKIKELIQRLKETKENEK